MTLQFTVLASGSGGNAGLLETEEFGLLIDAGLGPRQLGARLAAIGASWRRVQAVLITHLHNDHWKEPTFTHLRNQKIPLYCHAAHHEQLGLASKAFARLAKDGLVRSYGNREELALTAALRCRPLPLSHDGGATFGFRFEAASRDRSWSLAYLADLGCWSADLARELADVDLLALEFNHDVELESASGRSPWLIQRVLSDEGHLSNAQAAALVREVLRRSAPGRLQHLVQLHLSRHCNTPDLARAAAHAALADCSHHVTVHTACQDRPGPTLVLRERSAFSAASAREMQSSQSSGLQPSLPGFEG